MALKKYRRQVIRVRDANDELPEVILSTGDEAGRIIQLVITGGENYGTQCRFWLQKEEGVNVYQDMEQVTASYPTWEAAINTGGLEPGVYQAMFRVGDNDGSVTETFRTTARVLQGMLAEGEETEEMQSQLNEFEQRTEDALAANAQATQAATTAAEAATAATDAIEHALYSVDVRILDTGVLSVTNVDGVPTSYDVKQQISDAINPKIEDADAATQSANDAATAANSAATSATDAATAATGAATAATGAASAATQAATAANSAASRATSAASDASAAATSANSAAAAASSLNSRVFDIDGIIAPAMELGTIAMSSSAIAFNNSTTNIRTPQTGGIPVKYGDVVHLTDYTAAKFRYCVHKDSDDKYTYVNAYLTQDYKIINDGVLYLVVAYIDDATVIDVNDLASYVRILKNSGDIYEINNNLDALNAYESILEFGHFDYSLFGVGTYNNGGYNPTFRPWRVSTVRTLQFACNLYLTAKTGYRMSVSTYEDGAWVQSTWVIEYTIRKDIPFGLLLAKTTEDETSTANVQEFVDNIIVNTDLTSMIGIESIDIDYDTIEDFMSKFYLSNQTEAYAFFTDPHLMGYSGEFNETTFNKYINTLEETVKRTSAAYVVCGGDWLNNGDTKAQASAKLGYVDGRMRAIFPDKYYPIVGNHDFNYLGRENDERIPESGWISNSAMKNFWFHDHENCYYKFKEMTAQNYVLNTRTDYDGTNSYDKAMLDWLAANLIEDDAGHSTIMFHIYYLSTVGTTIPKRVVAIGKIIEAFNAHTICTLTDTTEGYDKTYDFSSTTGHIDYVIVGHTHADFSGTFGGVPVIGCDNFTEGNIPTFDLIFADYSNNKLYLTRIGTGESREFTI